MQPNKLTLISLLAGAIMFVLPWVEFQCQGRTLARQSGMQVAIGSISLAEEFNKLPGAADKKPDQGRQPGLLVLASSVMLAIALWGAWQQVRNEVHEPAKVGRFAGMALGLVCIQMAIGFPIDRQIKAEMNKSSGGKTTDPIEAALQQQIAGVFQTKYLPAFYLYLAALALPTLTWLAGPSRRENGNSDTTYTSQ